MKNVFEINKPKIFSRLDAREMLPLILRITEQSSQDVNLLVNRLEAFRGHQSEMASQIEQEINQVVTKWQVKVEKLGAIPKGMWLIDFDNGHGYFCWKYPESDILFQHGYQDGFTGRIMVCEQQDHLPVL